MVKSYSAAGATRLQPCFPSGSHPPAKYTHSRAVMVLPRRSPGRAFSASGLSEADFASSYGMPLRDVMRALGRDGR